MAGRLFTTKDSSTHQTTLASFMPGGRPFLAARMSHTNLYKLLHGLAYEIARAENLMNDITYEHQIDQTVLLIEEWESALGIPDDCFIVEDTIEKRRRNVLLKLASLGLQTEQDFIDLAAILGATIEIQQGTCYGIFPYPCTFPLEFFPYPQTARFSWRLFITGILSPCIFPFNGLFPICFSDSSSNLLECLFNKLIPANTTIEYIYVDYL